MATVNSDQVMAQIINDPAFKYQVKRTHSRDWNAKRLHYTSTYTVPAGGQAVGDIIRLVILQPGAVVVDFWYGWEAMSSGAGTAGADFGITGDGQRYLTALNMDAAGEKRAAWVLSKMPDRTPVPQGTDTFFIATVTGETWTAGKTLQGHIEVMGLA
jgi:hypothetical protein